MSEEDALLHKQDDGGSEETVDRSWLGDYKEDPSFQNYKDLNSVLKTFKNQESMLGERIKIPKDESNDDEYNKFVSKTRPKAIED